MDIKETITLIKLKKRHGLIQKVVKRTGISAPTVKKYLDGHVIDQKVFDVLNSALDVIREENEKH